MATGTSKTHSRETCDDITIGNMKLLNVLCTAEDERIHIDVESDDDMDAQSLMSSRAGSIVENSGYRPDDSDDEEPEGRLETAIDQSL